ncbi:cytochrome P450 family protein [Jatrophihabitans fulvus]
MKAGDMVAMPLAFAGFDDDAIDRATEIDIDRKVFGNLAFGAGPHRCLGSHLARRELVVAVEQWHQRIPHYRLTEGEQPIEHSGGGVAGLDYLPLSWD